MTKTYEQEIAETIIAQMGGASRLHIMVGADSFASGRIEYDGFEQPYVQFKFKMNRKMNYCRVIYEEGKDTYVMQFWKLRKESFTLIKEIADVYCDDLIPLFEETTGLHLVL